MITTSSGDAPTMRALPASTVSSMLTHGRTGLKWPSTPCSDHLSSSSCKYACKKGARKSACSRSSADAGCATCLRALGLQAQRVSTQVHALLTALSDHSAGLRRREQELAAERCQRIGGIQRSGITLINRLGRPHIVLLLRLCVTKPQCRRHTNCSRSGQSSCEAHGDYLTAMRGCGAIAVVAGRATPRTRFCDDPMMTRLQAV